MKRIILLTTLPCIFLIIFLLATNGCIPSYEIPSNETNTSQTTQTNKSQKNCAEHGEYFSEVYTSDFPKKCCKDLTEWNSGIDTRISVANKCYSTGLPSNSSVGICINCKNNICKYPEDICNCPQDCANNSQSSTYTFETFCANAYNIYCKNLAPGDKETEALLNLCTSCPETVKGCAEQGEWADPTEETAPNVCCEGLKNVNFPNKISIAGKCYTINLKDKPTTLICSNCGNNICETTENICSCPDDCEGANHSTYETIKKFCKEDYEEDYKDYCDGLFNATRIKLCTIC